MLASEVRDNIVVTANRSEQSTLEIIGNISSLDKTEIESTSATHIHELAVRVPGVWVSRGSGQEHLTAIRSPVLTGPGSCGAFLIMEDGIPTRPSGFCNVNQLFEIPTELADSIEVIRGPANALYGSNALHGTLNSILPSPKNFPMTKIAIKSGPNSYWRSKYFWNSNDQSDLYNFGLVIDHDGGFREDTGYEQIKFFGKKLTERANGVLTWSASGSWLDQETAGFIIGKDVYRNREIRFDNLNPEAFRKANSTRLSAKWIPNIDGPWNKEYQIFFRYSDMEFLQHFLPGKPLEKNNQISSGINLLATKDSWLDSKLTVGLDSEFAHGELDQFQSGPTQGSAFLQATRPEGQHYDYSVNSYSAAGFASWLFQLNPSWELRLGSRLEYLVFNYDNKMLDGNTRDDGTICGFGGCLYTRPSNRNDAFLNISPNIGLRHIVSPRTVIFANLATGFRAPQATELYRLQAQQNVNEIDSERIISAEVGVRHDNDTYDFEITGFGLRKSDYILRDSEGLNVSNGKSSHIGFETTLNWQISDQFYFDLAASFTQHQYRFNSDAALGEIISDGNEVDTAPPFLASSRIGYDFGITNLELEWVHHDDYYLDAANSAVYPGHDLINIRASIDLFQNWSIKISLNNATDEVYADRADLQSITDPVTYRYFPGRSREFFAEIIWQRN
ncbi:MAG: TonB-dependent receptor [Pseudomonadota bacterium]|nr:TonB-dependent receptor [Pseudomonadota bacterium]